MQIMQGNIWKMYCKLCKLLKVCIFLPSGQQWELSSIVTKEVEWLNK